jgi:hypothetical protein
MEGLENALAQSLQWLVTACNELVGALPYQIEGEQRRIDNTQEIESWHAKICFAERLRLQISFFDFLFPFGFTMCCGF